jgi:chromosome segregation ATPase
MSSQVNNTVTGVTAGDLRQHVSNYLTKLNVLDALIQRLANATTINPNLASNHIPVLLDRLKGDISEIAKLAEQMPPETPERGREAPERDEEAVQARIAALKESEATLQAKVAAINKERADVSELKELYSQLVEDLETRSRGLELKSKELEARENELARRDITLLESQASLAVDREALGKEREAWSRNMSEEKAALVTRSSELAAERERLIKDRSAWDGTMAAARSSQEMHVRELARLLQASKAQADQLAADHIQRVQELKKEKSSLAGLKAEQAKLVVERRELASAKAESERVRIDLGRVKRAREEHQAESDSERGLAQAADTISRPINARTEGIKLEIVSPKRQLEDETLERPNKRLSVIASSRRFRNLDVFSRRG